LLAAINNGQNKVIIQQLYRWYDQSRSANQPPTITSMITQDEQTLLESILAEPDKQIQTEDKLKLKRSIKNLRKQLSNKASIIDSSELNPV
jgi:3-phosphoglycerate kinase